MYLKRYILISDKYEYEVVAVVDKSSGIRSRHDLKEKKYCHPGYGYETDWSRIIANVILVNLQIVIY